MAAICNVKQDNSISDRGEVYDRVDAPIATGSAHLMRAGAELCLMHADLELGDTRQAAVRISSARAAVASALEEYESSHRLAKELDFYSLHNEYLSGVDGFLVGDTLRRATDLGLVGLSEAMIEAIERKYVDNGHEAAFAHFIAELTAFAARLAECDRTEADADPITWQHLGWKLLTAFNRVRVYGQALAIINTFEPSHGSAVTVH